MAERALAASLAEEAERALAGDARLEDPRFALGVTLAPLFVGFVGFVLARARALGVDRVYYFTREGEILVEVHRLLADATDAATGSTLPRAELLEVSRIATFGPSLQTLDPDELARFRTMYPSHSMATWLVSLGLEPGVFETHVVRHGLTVDEVLASAASDARVTRLFADPVFSGAVLDALAERRALLLAYLAARGIDANTGRVLVVDIGWRGTIQDNLAHLVPSVAWHGAYLALFRFHVPQPRGTTKVAYLYDDPAGDDGQRRLSPQAPIEMLFNASSGSVLGYRASGSDVVARRADGRREARVHATFTCQVQAGVLASVPSIARSLAAWRRDGVDPASELREGARAIVDGLLREPPAQFARAYFELEHDETFGLGRFVGHDDGRLLAFVRARSFRELRAAWRRLFGFGGWPAGFRAVHPQAAIPIAVSGFVKRARARGRS